MTNLQHRQKLRILDCVAAMQEAATLEDCARALVAAAMDIVPCDHAGYAEIDDHFGRTRSYFSASEIDDQVVRRAEVWRHYFPKHPVLKFRKANPSVPVVRLSDVTDLSDFYRSGLYLDLFTEVATRHQVVMHLGFDPAERERQGALPLALGISMNRGSVEFTDRDMANLAALRRVTRPIIRSKRAEHQIRLLDSADLTVEMVRSLMRLGLTDRQAEVAFWMLKGKSNTDIGTILGIGGQTVRHHSMAIFAQLGVGGRLALQRAVLRSILDAG